MKVLRMLFIGYRLRNATRCPFQSMRHVAAVRILMERGYKQSDAEWMLYRSGKLTTGVEEILDWAKVA